jgi:hypothetical protein
VDDKPAISSSQPTRFPGRRAQMKAIAEDYFRGLAQRDMSAVPWSTDGVLNSPLMTSLRDQEAGWVYAVQEAHAGRIGITRLAEAFRNANPEKGRGCPVDPDARQRQDEGGRGSRVAHTGRMDLGQARVGQAAAQRCVETFGAGGKKTAARHAAMPDEVDVFRSPVEAFGEAARLHATRRIRAAA